MTGELFMQIFFYKITPIDNNVNWIDDIINLVHDIVNLHC